MTPPEITTPGLAEAATRLRDQNEPFAFATIIRTAGATAAKPGSKALLSADGAIVQGWLGGGCTHAAVRRAAVAAFASGTPQLISIAPEELLAEKGVSAGHVVDGVSFARNGCPSRGTIDIFIEPCLPQPELIVLGASPVARALLDAGAQFGWAMKDELSTVPDMSGRLRCVAVATQGAGDFAALRQAIESGASYVGFVGSKAKFASLAEKLIADGATAEQVATIKGPAGLDIGAVTPEEIALSILADFTRFRRRAFLPSNDS